ncbi:Cytochrome c553 [Noviherbaspirillum humi]|uniref:Cytochrome c553 n=1 Tax=Noviherbaspirillum humi TaxID=1688639 RepID=A0A239FGK6_9BURK|nr:c-type cytochrome [Noviherbaspirillum humi]SNS55885.1 Cytochrome c553 [Noviherbaspirillum humi]
MRLNRLPTAFAFFVLAATAPLQAAENAGNGQRLAATCAGCHGTAGITRGDVLPPLAGQSKAALIASMKAFQSGQRPASIMHQIAKGYSDEQIEAMAGYFASQRTNAK